MPKVSVIIPVFNTEKYLKKCLDSVCNQTLSDIEIICINDCSPDNSIDILNEYAQKDDRIKIIDFKENKGVSIARNIGIDEAKGEYIGFVDSDDFIDLDFYEKLYTKAFETGADAVKGSMYEINDTDIEPILPIIYDLNSSIRKNAAYFYYTFTTAIYNTDFIRTNNINFPEEFCHLEDPFFTIKAGFCYRKIELVDSAKYYYNTTMDTRKKKPDEKKILDSLSKASVRIVELLNNADISKEHYLIVFNFVLVQNTERFNDYYIPDEIFNILKNSLQNIFNICKYKSECLTFFYQERRRHFHEYNKNDKLRKLRKIRNLV